MRYFWEAVEVLDSLASEFEEGGRFPICQLINILNGLGSRPFVAGRHKARLNHSRRIANTQLRPVAKGLIRIVKSPG